MRLSRSLPVLLALLAAPLLLPLQRVARAAEAPTADAAAEARCRDALSTVEMNRCLIGALEAVDRRLDQALARVAAEAAGVPGGTFQTL
ncbi:MAG: hypothetical protein ACOVNL_13875 [Prochlorococcaceae cyanobacterium]|jgi:hypothetical protein